MTKSSWKQSMTGAAVVFVLAAALVLNGCEEAPTLPEEPAPSTPPTEPTLPSTAKVAVISAEAGRSVDEEIDAAVEAGRDVSVDAIAHAVRAIEGVVSASPTPSGSAIVAELDDGTYVNVVVVRMDDDRLFATAPPSDRNEISGSVTPTTDRNLTQRILQPQASTPRGKGRVLILEPHPEIIPDWLLGAKNAVRNAKRDLQSIGYEVAHHVGTDVGIEKFETSYWAAFDVVYIMTHGVHAYAASGSPYQTLISTGVEYSYEVAEHLVKKFGASAVAITKLGKKSYISVSADFFRKTKATELPGTYVFVAACESDKRIFSDDKMMADAMLDAGAGAYSGFDEVVNRQLSFRIVERLTDRLVVGSSLTAASDAVRKDPDMVPWYLKVAKSVDDAIDATLLDEHVRTKPFYILKPSFGGKTMADQTYTAGTAMEPLRLPAATGGRPFTCDPDVAQSCSPGLRYSVSGLPTGLRFDATTRTVSGTPTATVSSRTVTYQVMDANAATDSIRFRITVQGAATPPTPGNTFRDCAECPLMVEVPSGSYVMGSPPTEQGRWSSEGPQHRVTIGYRLAVGVYEVTFAEWDACVADGGCNGYRPYDRGWGRGARPVIHVSWVDAQAYVGWLSRKTGRRYRLLSESEWEYVARAGTTTRYHTGDTITSSQANYGQSVGRTVEVGSYPANAFGLHDVHGNVWEWTQDCWNGSYRGAPADGSAWESGDCARRAFRGGSWTDIPQYVRSAKRVAWEPRRPRYDHLGFRVARTATGTIRNDDHADPRNRFDTLMIRFTRQHDISVAALGVMQQGRVTYNRAFGHGDDVLMRIASVTKPITAAAIRNLADDGRLSLDDFAFDLGQAEGGVLRLDPFPRLGDERLKKITVLHLLRHRGGWDREVAGDLVFREIAIARAMSTASPPGRSNTVRYILGQPLQFEPGARREYSNIGYMVLGLIIEKASGQDYLTYVYENVFRPLGVPHRDIIQGRTFPQDRSDREPFYESRSRCPNVFDPSGSQVPCPDGGWDHEAKIAHGGLVASTSAILKFLDQYIAWGDHTGMRRTGGEVSNWWTAHSGSLDGTNTLAYQRGNGTNYVVMFNSRASSGTSYTNLIRPEIESLLGIDQATVPPIPDDRGLGLGVIAD